MNRRSRRRPSGNHDPGEVPTWEQVADQYGGFLYTVCYRLTGNRDDAQDLVQDVLIRVRRGLRTYEPGSLEGWLSRIATNAFLDDVRRRKRRPADPFPEDDPERILPTSAAPDEELATEKLPDEVQGAITGLPPDYRAAVVLSDVVGLSYQEIADQLEIPVGTVRSRIHRGRARLREVLA